MQKVFLIAHFFKAPYLGFVGLLFVDDTVDPHARKPLGLREVLIASTTASSILTYTETCSIVK